MTIAHPYISAVIIDSADPERLAAFWSALLGRPVAARVGPYVFLARGTGTGTVTGDGTVLGFQRSAAAGAGQTGKNRVHLDIAAADPVAEQARIEALGGRRLHAYDGGGFLVMADIEGNEFCVIPQGRVDLDDEGRAHYLDDSRR